MPTKKERHRAADRLLRAKKKMDKMWTRARPKSREQAALRTPLRKFKGYRLCRRPLQRLMIAGLKRLEEKVSDLGGLEGLEGLEMGGFSGLEAVGC